MDDPKLLESRLDKLLSGQRDGDWPTAVMILSTDIWQHLGSVEAAAPALLDKFTAILVEREGFALARLVVPEFRDAHQAQPGSSPRDIVLTRIVNAKASYYGFATTSWAPDEQDFYEAEKRIYADVEAYRAGLHLYGTAVMTPSQKQEVQRILGWAADDGEA